jgi:hypothetical protein
LFVVADSVQEPDGLPLTTWRLGVLVYITAVDEGLLLLQRKRTKAVYKDGMLAPAAV